MIQLFPAIWIGSGMKKCYFFVLTKENKLTSIILMSPIGPTEYTARYFFTDAIIT